MSDTSLNRQTAWLDLKIPLWGVITLAIGLLTQSATLIIWGAKMDQRVAAVEAKVETVGKLGETVARMDERTLSLVTTVNRIESQLSEKESRR